MYYAIGRQTKYKTWHFLSAFGKGTGNSRLRLESEDHVVIIFPTAGDAVEWLEENLDSERIVAAYNIIPLPDLPRQYAFYPETGKWPLVPF